MVEQGKKYEAVVIGSSAGGLNVLKRIFSGMNPTFQLPVIVVQHLSPDMDNYLPFFLDNLKKLTVKEADEKESPRSGVAYVAPPNYHLLLETDRTFTLTVEERVNYARPSIDVLFETAAEAYGDKLIGIILTGANSDGTRGLKRIKEMGGLAIVQDPEEAESVVMPRSAIENVNVDHVMKLDDLIIFLNHLA